MRLALKHLTARRSAVGLAILGLTLWVIAWDPWRLTWDRELERKSAEYHAKAEAYAWIRMEMFSGDLVRWKIRLARDAWADRTARKYWHAARYPWEPVEPDEPPPAPVVKSGLNVLPGDPSNRPSLESSGWDEIKAWVWSLF